MDGLNFFNSYWQFSRVNLNMTNCKTAFLALELNYSTNVKIENSTFGHWTFKQVQNIIMKNCSNSVDKDSKPLSCTFPLWKIITLCVGCPIVLLAAMILNKKWSWIKYRCRSTNDDDSQDLSKMTYDVFVSYRYFLFPKVFKDVIPSYFFRNKLMRINFYQRSPR